MLLTTLPGSLCPCGRDKVAAGIRGVIGYLRQQPMADPYNMPLPILLPYARADFDSILPADFYSRAGIDFDRMLSLAGPALMICFDICAAVASIVITVDGKWLREHKDRLTAHGTPPTRKSLRLDAGLDVPIGLSLAMLGDYLEKACPAGPRHKGQDTVLPAWAYPPAVPDTQAAARSVRGAA